MRNRWHQENRETMAGGSRFAKTNKGKSEHNGKEHAILFKSNRFSESKESENFGVIEAIDLGPEAGNTVNAKRKLSEYGTLAFDWVAWGHTHPTTSPEAIGINILSRNSTRVSDLVYWTTPTTDRGWDYTPQFTYLDENSTAIYVQSMEIICSKFRICITSTDATDVQNFDRKRADASVDRQYYPYNRIK